MSGRVYLLAMIFCCRPSQHKVKIDPVYSLKYVVLMRNYITYSKRKVTFSMLMYTMLACS